MIGHKPEKFKSPIRIMVFGAFDYLHPGHEHFFKQARALAKNPYLIVSVARSKNVKKIKGRLPWFSEKQRLRFIKDCKLVDKGVLSSLTNHLPHILRQKPRIIALGHDQKRYTQNLAKDLAKLGLKVKIKRLKPHKRGLFKSSIFKKNI